MSVMYDVMPEWSSMMLEGAVIEDQKNLLLSHSLTDSGIVEIIELKNGIRINSNSYVGRVSLGAINLHITPKLDKLPLGQLMQYTYGFKDLRLYGKAFYLTGRSDFFDLLIYTLYAYVDELLDRGFIKGYMLRDEESQSIKGRIDIDRVAGRGGIVASTLPCKYYQREEDTPLNRMLLSGLRLAQDMAANIRLKYDVRRMADHLSGFVTEMALNRSALTLVEMSINRLTESYVPIIEIVDILLAARAEQMNVIGNETMLPGYFFDMNLFFETLVSKLLKTLPDGYTVIDQYRLKRMISYAPDHNPLRRSPPTPRPDFVVMKAARALRIIDAKYRDLWERDLPRDMLYQLSMYAMSGIAENEATIIYPALSDEPELQIINVNDPVREEFQIARIRLQPLNLNKVADLISRNSKSELGSYICETVGLAH